MCDPRERSRSITFLAFLFIACLLLCSLAIAAPSITLSKKSGPPTSKILVSGRGFEPNVGVDIFFDTKDEALVVTNSKGEFDKAGIHAPRSAYPGNHWITALERNNDKGVQKGFLVQTNWSQFRFEADGTRLNPYENVLNPNTIQGIDLKWSYATGDALNCQPAVADGVVYVGSSKHNVYALNAKTGTKLWSFNAGIYGVWNSSPAVADGVVYFGSVIPNVYALNAKTGAKLWSFTTGGSVESSPAVANGVVYVGSDDGNVYALDAKTGTKLWSYLTADQVYSSPAVVDGVVYAGSIYGDLYALNARTGAMLWSYPTGNVGSSPAVVNGVVYVGSGLSGDQLYALDARTGTLLWSYATGGYAVDSSPAVANGVVYFAGTVSDSERAVYALNASTGDLLWSYVSAFVGESPVVANGVVFSSTSALSASTGALLWSGDLYSFGGQTIVANGVVYISSVDDGKLYAFARTRSPAEQAADSKRPVVRMLHSDFNLKVSKPFATTSGAKF